MYDIEKRHPFDVVPELARLTKDVLFADVWEDPELSKRDRSLTTCAILAAMHREAELDFQMQRALENGVSERELKSLITHVAFYAGWPAAMAAGGVAAERLDQSDG